jgi:hypothetical protein
LAKSAFVAHNNIESITGNAQVLERAANRQNVTLGLVEIMFGSEASDDAVGGDDIHNIQANQSGTGLRGGGAIILQAAGDVRVRGLETSEPRNAEISDERLRVPSIDRKASGGLGLDIAGSGPVETGVQRVSSGVVGEGLDGTGTHIGLLN